MTPTEQRIHDQTLKAAQVGFAAHAVARQIGALVPWSKLTESRQRELFEAADLVRSALVLEPVRPEVIALRGCNKRYLGVSFAFVGAAMGFLRDCGIDAFNP